MVMLVGLTRISASHAATGGKLAFWAVAVDFLLLVAMGTLAILLARDQRRSSDPAG